MSITARGGYQILDFENKPISTNEITIPGIYQKCQNIRNKGAVICNLVLNLGEDTICPVVFNYATFAFSESPAGYNILITYFRNANINMLRLVITDSDGVKYVANT